jgi:hypothetical protein
VGSLHAVELDDFGREEALLGFHERERVLEELKQAPRAKVSALSRRLMQCGERTAPV